MYTKEGIKYTQSHEWLRKEGEYIFIGITDYAQEALGDIAYVEMPEIGDVISKGEPLCTLESPKAASEVYMPEEGEVVEINKDIEIDPGAINESPYSAWIAKVLVKSNIGGLLSQKEYEAFIESLEKEGH